MTLNKQRAEQAKKQRTIEAMLYCKIKIQTCKSIGVWTHICTVVWKYCCTVVWKCRFVFSRNQRCKSMIKQWFTAIHQYLFTYLNIQNNERRNLICGFFYPKGRNGQNCGNGTDGKLPALCVWLPP